MNIRLFSKQDQAFIQRQKDPITIIGKIEISFVNGQWSWSEKINPVISKKEQAEVLFNSADTIFIAEVDGKQVGDLIIREDWNGYVWIEEIDVSSSYRRQGIGHALIEKAKAYATDHHLAGLALESQDTNVIAARFYHQEGFKINGINTAFYRHMGKPYQDEIAVFWYLDLQ